MLADVMAESVSVGEAFDAVETVMSLDTVMVGVDMSAEGEAGAESLVAGRESTGQYFHIFIPVNRLPAVETLASQKAFPSFRF